MYAKMVLWWRDLKARITCCNNSNSSPLAELMATTPNGITKITNGVYKLKEPTKPLEVEIVFIHGLDFHDYHEAYWKTWTSEKNDKDGKEFIWPMVWLAEDVPGARIWSLSYDPTAWRTYRLGTDKISFGENLVYEVVELAKIGQHQCPIVFVCHGLGSLLVKEIVILAHHSRRKEKYQKFLQNVRAFLFYLVPHDDLYSVDHFKKMPKRQKMVSLLDSKEICYLNSNFEFIERKHYPNQWRSSNIDEAHCTKVPCMAMSSKVVEEASTQHGYTTFGTMQTNHFGVSKPKEKTSSNYLALVDFIKDVMHDKPTPHTNDEAQANLLVGHARDELMQKTTNICSSLT